MIFAPLPRKQSIIPWPKYFLSHNAFSIFISNIYSDIVIADPTLIEEKRAEATVVFGLNSYRELCGLHFGGITLASINVLLKCANQGAKRANSIVALIKSKLEEDTQKRYAPWYTNQKYVCDLFLFFS